MILTAGQRRNILEDSQDIRVLDVSADSYSYALKPGAETLRFLEQSKTLRSDSTFLSNLATDRELRHYGFRLPNWIEINLLRESGAIPPNAEGVYGAVLFDGRLPNRDIANDLMMEAKYAGLRTPLIIPFSAMDYFIDNGRARVYLNNPDVIVKGEEAIDQIRRFSVNNDHTGLRMLHFNNGQWHLPPYSINSTRLDNNIFWICGETPREESTHWLRHSRSAA